MRIRIIDLEIRSTGINFTLELLDVGCFLRNVRLEKIDDLYYLMSSVGGQYHFLYNTDLKQIIIDKLKGYFPPEEITHE
jgi:hypothetical protein